MNGSESKAFFLSFSFHFFINDSVTGESNMNFKQYFSLHYEYPFISSTSFYPKLALKSCLGGKGEGGETPAGAPDK